MSTGRESAGGDDQFQDGSASDAAANQPDNIEDRTALDQVLKETLDALSHEKITAQEIESLRDVARRHPNSSLNIDPITCQLVDVILQHRCFIPGSEKHVDSDISREIATCLHDAPASHRRLENFWNKLRESVK